MRTFSRAAVLLSTAALGGLLVSTPAASFPTIVSASTTQTNATGLTLTDGTYDVNLNVYKTGTTDTSAMMQYMNNTGSLTVKNGNVTIDISAKSQQNMDMMTSFSVMGHDAKKDGLHWIVTMPTSDWQATLPTHMVIDVPAIGWHEEPDADLVIDTANATKTSVDAPTSSEMPPTLSPIDTTTPVSLEADAPITIDQGMDAWFKPVAHLAVKGDITNVTLTFNDDKVGALKLIPYVQLDSKTQTIDGQSVTFTIPTADLKPGSDNKVTLKSFTSVPMSPSKGYPANVTFDMTNIWSKTQPTTPGLDPQPTTQPDTPAETPKPTTSTPDKTPSTSVPTSTQQQVADNHSELHALKILRSDNNEDSIAGQYFLSSIKLDKNADGSYTAYITSHTPKMMGQNPITFTDSKHQATLVNTVDKGDAYESTFSLHLAANELNNAIATFIHVQFTSPISYNENYEIRLVVGKLLSAPSTTTGTTTNTATTTALTSLAPTANTLVSHETIANALQNDATLMTATPTNNNVPAQNLTTPAPVVVSPIDNALTTTPASQMATPNKMSTTIKPASDQKHAPATHTTKEKQIKLKTPTKQPVKQTTSVMQSPTKRAAIIGIGVALAAAIGFIGTTLLVNFFKGH